MDFLKFMAGLALLVAVFFIGTRAGPTPPPPPLCEPIITQKCNCREDIDRHLTKGLCQEAGGIRITPPGSNTSTVIHGIPPLAAPDGGLPPPNFDGIQAALGRTAAAVNTAEANYKASKQQKDGGK